MSAINKKIFHATLLSLAILSLFSCTSNVDGTHYLGRPGSPIWFKTASQATINNHFSKICENYGFKKGTNQFSSCIQTEVINNKSRNAARRRGNDSYPTANTYSSPVYTPPAPKVETFCRNGRVMTQYGCRYR